MPRYNIAPTQLVPIVRARTATRGSCRCCAGPGTLLDQRPVDRQPHDQCPSRNRGQQAVVSRGLQRRRCLVPADGYFEWQKTGRAKQPYYIRLRDEQPFAMAGLWELWRDANGEILETFAIITTEANQATRAIHDRMPVILSPTDYARWLDPEFEQLESLQDLLQPYAGGPMQLDPVSTLVNNPRNDSPQCIAVR